MSLVTSITIVRGEDRTFSIYLRKKSDQTLPIDLTGVTAASLKLPNEDGTQLELTLGSGLVVPNPATGKIDVTINDTQSAALNPGDLQSCRLVYEKGSDKRIVALSKFLTVEKDVFEA